MTESQFEEDAVQALVRAYVACRVACEALPSLPTELRARIEEPVRLLCAAVGPELEKLRPGGSDG